VRTRWLVPALGAACAVAAVTAVFLVAGGSGTETAEAAGVLRAAAKHARAETSLGQLGPEQYLYTKSTNAYLVTSVEHGGSYSALVPRVREVWLRSDGTGWLLQTAGTPTFLTDRDRRAWIAAGRPSLGNDTMDVELKNSDGPTPPMASLDLPTDADALYARLHHDAAGFGDRTYTEMFVMIGDDLRENYVTTAQRAALFEVAARLPGIVYLGPTRDAAGRPAVAVAMDDSHSGVRDVLLFGRDDHAFLGEEETALAGNSFGLPAGVVVGQAMYLEQRVVDDVPREVVEGATG